MAAYAEGFNDKRAAFSPDTEEEILVLSADGKGVPMRRPLEQRLHEHQATAAPAVRTEQEPSNDAPPRDAPRKPKRLKRGEKRTRGRLSSGCSMNRSIQDVN